MIKMINKMIKLLKTRGTNKKSPYSVDGAIGAKVIAGVFATKF